MDDHDIAPDQTDQIDQIEYRVVTEFDADPSEVWRALSEPESMREWLGRPVVVEEVDDQRRLVFRWASATEAPTVVELDLRPSRRGTHLTIVERPIRLGRVTGTTARACALAYAA